MFFGFFLVFLILQISEGKPVVQNALVYLSQYGYLEPGSMNSSAQVNARTFKKSLEEFQAFTGLPVTGKLDDETLELMSMPRCGVKDKIGSSEQLENFVVQGSKWKTKNLNYRITKYSRHLNRATVDRTIQRAFNLWSKYTDLTFERTNNRRGHIEIRFEEGRHGDGDAFDGPGGTLAHAFFPQFGGTTHFDDSERWSVNGSRGTDLFQTAAHEFGHALGLKHSQIRQALMAPFYKGYVPDLDLWRDDIQGIQKLYGSRNSTEERTERPRRPSRPSPRRRKNRKRFPRRRFPRRRFPRRRFPNQTPNGSPNQNDTISFPTSDQPPSDSDYPSRPRHPFQGYPCRRSSRRRFNGRRCSRKRFFCRFPRRRFPCRRKPTRSPPNPRRTTTPRTTRQPSSPPSIPPSPMLPNQPRPTTPRNPIIPPFPEEPDIRTGLGRQSLPWYSKGNN